MFPSAYLMRYATSMTPAQHIVVATDFGSASTRALEVAAEIANQFGARVTVLHVVEDRPYARGCPFPPEIRRAAAFRLDETVHDLRRKVPAVEGMLREGFAWSEIVEGAAETGADLVIVGSHGDGDGRRFFIGSVAEKVVRICPVPVLTVHAWRFEDRCRAGRELAEVLVGSGIQVPSVVAVSRRSVMVAAEVAEAFGAPLRVLLTRALRRDSSDVGAVCEDGTVFLEGRGADKGAHRESGDAERVHAELLDEARHLSGPRWQEDRNPGTILLVSDAILAPAPIIVAAEVLRRRGPRRLIAAAPVATFAARDALQKVVDGIVVVQMIENEVPLERLYRDLSAPGDGAVVERLAAASQWAKAVATPP